MDEEVIEAVEQLRKEKNVTVILITHYMEVIDADQVFVMDEGHVVMMVDRSNLQPGSMNSRSTVWMYHR